MPEIFNAKKKVSLVDLLVRWVDPPDGNVRNLYLNIYFKFQSLHILSSFVINVLSRRKKIVSSILGSLPPSRETQMEFHYPALGKGQSWLWQAFGIWSRIFHHSHSLSVSQTCFQKKASPMPLKLSYVTGLTCFDYYFTFKQVIHF